MVGARFLCAFREKAFLAPVLSSYGSTTFNAGYYYCLEEAMAPHSSTLAWKIPWVEEPGGLQSMGSLRVGHD